MSERARPGVPVPARAATPAATGPTRPASQPAADSGSSPATAPPGVPADGPAGGDVPASGQGAGDGPAPSTLTDGVDARHGPVPDDAAIRVHRLGVVYSLKLTKKQTLRDSLIRRVKRTGETEFWALRDVTFHVEQGESLGVIGPNGAGKSTLLQVLSGILMPSEGIVEVDGHVSSLLTLGVGFDQDLSGVDNIRLAGAFMGLPHREVEDRLQRIIDYAELGQFIDAPIKTYSSGMRARLGFAIATSVDPDILLLDEVLATGDAAFREKSKQRVLELVKAAKAIVLVTHDMSWVTEYCNRAMLLERGRIVSMGSPEEVVALHQERTAQRRAEAQAKGVLQVKSGPFG